MSELDDLAAAARRPRRISTPPPPRTSRLPVMLGVAGALVIVAVAFHSPPERKESAAIPSASPETPDPIQIDATDLTGQTGEIAQAHKGAKIRVTGYVTKVDVSWPRGLSSISLAGRRDANGRGVLCLFTPIEKPAVQRVNRGDFVMIFGTCGGQELGNPIVNSCVLERSWAQGKD